MKKNTVLSFLALLPLLLGARALALAWTAGGGLLVYVLARRGAPVPGGFDGKARALEGVPVER